MTPNLAAAGKSAGQVALDIENYAPITAIQWGSWPADLASEVIDSASPRIQHKVDIRSLVGSVSDQWAKDCLHLRKLCKVDNLADKSKPRAQEDSKDVAAPCSPASIVVSVSAPPPPSRVGRKAIAAYFSPDMSMAMHVCARKNGFSLQVLMTEAFDDVLRKYGESPIGG